MSMRWSPEALADFERRRKEWEKKGQKRVHQIYDEPEPRRRGQKAERVKFPRRSKLELLLEQQMALVGIAATEIEHRPIVDRGFRLDFAWPELKIGIEVQGMVHRIKGRFKNDIEKRALVLLAGWRVLEVGGAEIRSGVAAGWIEQLLKQARGA